MRSENGRPVWQDTLARTGVATSVAMLSDIDASPAIDEGRFFAIGPAGRMAAVELAPGPAVWEVNISGLPTPWPAGDWVSVGEIGRSSWRVGGCPSVLEAGRAGA